MLQQGQTRNYYAVQVADEVNQVHQGGEIELGTAPYGGDISNSQQYSSYGTVQQLATLPLSPLTSPSLKKHSPEVASTMSMTAAIFSLAKVLIGAGMLALPGGMAAGKGTGLIPAAIIMAFSALASAYTFYIIGISLHATKTKTFKELMVATRGPRAGTAVNGIILALGLCLGLLYADFVGDLFATLLRGWLPAWAAQRQVVILILTATVLGPLCLQRDLNALRHSSAVGIASVLYIAAFMLLRLADGSYAPGGRYAAQAAAAAAAAAAAHPPPPGPWGVGLGSAVLMSMLVTAFTAHQNAPQFATQLEGYTRRRLAAVTAAAWGLAGLLYAAVGVAGYLTFGMGAQALVLDNYADADAGAQLARAATGVSVLCSAPIVFAAFRESVAAALRAALGPGRAPPDFHALSVALLALVTALSLVVSDVGLLVALIGSACDGPLMFVLPALAHLEVLRRSPQELSSGGGKWAVWGNQALVGLGALMAVFCTAVAVLNTYTTLLK